MEVINKVIITPEALSDYAETVGMCKQQLRVVREELEEYIDRMGDRLMHAQYFRCEYLDERTGRMLMLFVYRSSTQRLMQNWTVRGVCESADWTEDSEYYGDIKNWIDSKITELNDSDWVLRYRVRLEEKARLAALDEKEDSSVTKEQVKELLEQYEIMNNQAAVMEQTASLCTEGYQDMAEKYSLITLCIRELPEQEKLLVQNVYVKKRGISRTAREMGYTRRGLYYKMDKILIKLATCLSIFKRFT